MKCLYCWKISFGKLDIYMVSSKRGAVRIGIDWKNVISPLAYFRRFFSEQKLLINESYNLPLIAAVKNMLEGKGEVKISIDVYFNPFQLKVLNVVKKIPFGKTVTYKDIAIKLNNPHASRAVGQVLSKNPLPIIFP